MIAHYIEKNIWNIFFQTRAHLATAINQEILQQTMHISSLWLNAKTSRKGKHYSLLIPVTGKHEQENMLHNH